MPEFTLQYGVNPLCRWHTETGAREVLPNARLAGQQLVLNESDPFSFVLSPSGPEMEYAISVGDIPIAEMLPNPLEAEGIPLPGQRIWREHTYFESARGETEILIRYRNTTSLQSEWETLLGFTVYVVPSKLGEASYQRMAEDLEGLSRSLLVDLYGKSRSTFDIRFAQDAQIFESKEEELDAIWAAVNRLSTLLSEISKRPASRVIKEDMQMPYWGTERIGRRGLDALSRQGVSIKKSPRPVTIVQTRLREVFDIKEHRVVMAFFDILEKRATLCMKAAREHTKAIEAERHLRDMQLGDGPTIYEAIDLPKIQRLKEAAVKARDSLRMLRAFRALPFLKDVKPDLKPIIGGDFQRGEAYKALFSLIRNFLIGNVRYYEGEAFQAVTKLTSRLFEQWCFLSIVDAFRDAGLDLRDWDDSLRHNLRSRFIVDFDRGLQFSGLLTNGLRLNIRYEPWILGEEAAERVGDTLCRGTAGRASWCPDIVLECLKEQDGTWEPVYAVVLDSKYTIRLTEHHWRDGMKYLQIRSTRTKRQIVKQLWLISLHEEGEITCEDPAVVFQDSGLSCTAEDTVQLSLGVNPQPKEKQKDIFNTFAVGMVDFFRRTLY